MNPALVGKYRKKPLVIDALQWNGHNNEEVLAFGNSGPNPMWGDDFVIDIDEQTVEILTIEGKMKANLGDWIIRGVAGEFYPCKHAIFQVSYSADPGSAVDSIEETLQLANLLLQAFRWCAGSEEFNSGGKAEQGYTTYRQQIDGRLHALPPYSQICITGPLA